MPAKVKKVTAQKDYPQFGILRGEEHYFWQLFTNGRGYPQRSKTAPRPSQLESSEYLIQYYSLREEAEDLSGGAEPEDIESLISSVEQLQSETQDKLSNMPDGLRNGDTGVLLQERVDELEEWLAALRDIEQQVDESEPDPAAQRAALLQETL